MKHNFLKSLDLPKSVTRHLPSIEFERGLNQWIDLRSAELESSSPPDYRYFAEQFEFVSHSCWDNHDSRFELETSDATNRRSRAYHDAWSFGALGDYPARVLSSIAFQFGWRLVPYARWVAQDNR